ncbi:MAG: universal stress protein [Acidobacteria bacterium]|nr:universal stress protein [Acidobacteriota bacterium]
MPHILFPVDFSAPCANIAPAVHGWAVRSRADVTLLHVHETPFLAIDHPNLVAELATLREASHCRLDAFLLHDFPEVAVRRLQLDGRPGSAITDYAAANGISLIMLPTHGYTRFRQLLLGSVVASVLHDSEIPVWTSAHAEAPPLAPLHVHETPFLAIDHPNLVAELATLRVVYCHPANSTFPSATADRAHQLVHEAALEHYQSIAGDLDLPEYLEVLEEPTLVEGVQNSIATHKTDLLIIGRGRIQGVLGRLRSNSHDLIRSAPCPVLSV